MSARLSRVVVALSSRGFVRLGDSQIKSCRFRHPKARPDQSSGLRARQVDGVRTRARVCCCSHEPDLQNVFPP